MNLAKVNNIEICYEKFGNSDNPALLLIMGGCCQGILWPIEFCLELVAAGFYVIRYDHRDTGYSTSIDYQNHPYDITDMAKDAWDLLNYIKVDRAHLVGLSMGGPIAEIIAVNYPEKIRTITLIATSSEFRPMNLAYAGLPEELFCSPPPFDIYLNWMKKFLNKPPNNKNEHIELRLEGWKILNGFAVPFEEELYCKLQQEFIDRTRDFSLLENHLKVCQRSEEIVRSICSSVKVPTLILHGSDDPVFPVEHGKTLADAIKHSKFELINGMGHVLNKVFYSKIIRMYRHESAEFIAYILDVGKMTLIKAILSSTVFKEIRAYFAKNKVNPIIFPATSFPV